MTLRTLLVPGAILIGALLTGCLEGAVGEGEESNAPTGPAVVYSRPVEVSELHRFSAVAAGYHHSCAIEDDGSTWCWGANEWGQLGSSDAMQRCAGGNFACSPTPLRVVGSQRFTRLAGSIRHTCGLDDADQAWCWGFGIGGQLGDGLRADSAQPVAVSGGHRFAGLKASVSGHVTCGLTRAGEAWCWGPDTDGMLGNGTRTGSVVPVQVVTPHALSSISVGDRHACGVDTTGTAYCWGLNWFGQLGVGSAGGSGGFSRSTTPVQVTDGHSFREIAAGGEHTCALTPAGTAYCWGVGHLTGTSASASYVSSPVAVEGGHNFADLSAGFTHTCGRTATGALYCWGENWEGKLGDGTTVESRVPVRVASTETFSSVVAAGTHSCALSTDRRGWCWGGNPWGGVGRPPSDP